MIDTASYRTLFILWGVPWKLTPKSWLFVPTRMGFCVFLALVFLPRKSIGSRILLGVSYTLLLLSSQALHIVGHTLGGKLVGAPMDANLILDTKILTYYESDPMTLPRRVHLGRALGGPLVNVCVSIVAAVAWALKGGHLWPFLMLVNLALGLGVLLPIRGMDGEILWRELRR